MPAGLQDLKKRIKSIKSTRQVTKAMEAVAASKMRKAVEMALISRNYSSLGWQLINNLAQVTDESMHPLLRKRDNIKKILLIFITSDKGLCGGLNSQVIRTMYQFLEENKDKEIEVISIGKKGQHILRKINKKIIGAYLGMADNPTLASLRPITQTVLTSFISNKYDQVNIIFTDFKSALSQRPILRQLLPLQKGGLEEIVGSEKDMQQEKKDTLEYIFEPDTQRLLDYLLPRLMEVQIYQAMLESTASEHSSRMMAMRNATDSATEMIDDLTLTYNQIRQSSITQEIAEISAGRIALEN
jgi:F-type H+-transporting ATPase subunit gamma